MTDTHYNTAQIRFGYNCFECGQVNEREAVHTGCKRCGRDAVERFGSCDECRVTQPDRWLAVMWNADNTEAFTLCPCCAKKATDLH